MPTEPVDHVAGQVGAADASVVKGYLRRRLTRFEHQWEIVREYGYTDFADAEPDLVRWIDDRAWTTGDSPGCFRPGRPDSCRICSTFRTVPGSRSWSGCGHR
ncbi:transposase [Actinoplanes sp. SE50]|uniref:DUF4158 domain-containing protein n=1 Tax=unclassified Actinoplanes TaxID=2626549 RepID=UPI00023EBD73|nr:MULTISPECIES: DUF4158 domain-containing protein [unclassified Actinoplanes]AEV85113.1 transposase [Actinoplanes sp. SE50/110]ATO83504.1 transposase [Actinoplanes sp. SE50]SLM00911.1 transposase [Actinoplanes sp. SE50/110]